MPKSINIDPKSPKINQSGAQERSKTDLGSKSVPGYDKIENFMKLYVKIDPKNEPKIDVWAIRGPTFEVLGAFLKSLIFNEFSIGNKSAKNLMFWVRGSAKDKLPARVGG